MNLKPAPIRTDRGFRLQFSLGGRQYKYGRIKDENDARLYQSRVNTLVLEFKKGQLTIPTGISFDQYIFALACHPEQAQQDLAADLIPLSQVLEEYKTAAKPPHKAYNTYKTELVHISNLQKFLVANDYGDPLVSHLDVKFFERYRQYRYGQSRETDTVNKELGTFNLIFKMAVKYGYLPQNVVAEVERDKSHLPADRFQSLTEIDAAQHGNAVPQDDDSHRQARTIKRFCYLTPKDMRELITLTRDTWLYAVVMVLAYTGMRRGELVRLRWADVNLESQTPTIGVKSHKQSRTHQEKLRTIALDPLVIPALREQKLKSGTGQWVFQGFDGGQLKPDYLWDCFERRIKGTRFEGIGLHIFRHSYASNLAAQGVDQRFIDKQLGHTTKEMQERYRHLTPTNVQSVISGKLNYV